MSTPSQILADAHLSDADVPWWALSVLDLAPKTDAHRIREVAQSGELRRIGKSPEMLKLWSEVVARARRLADRYDIPGVVAVEPELCRYGALSSPRAFYQFCGIEDDAGNIPTLKDFQVKGIRHMRQQEHCLELWPFSFGKSWHSSITVPLMDWAESPEFTQGRIYYNHKFVKGWTRLLMHIVENNQRLHDLFPWVARPDVGDPCDGIWSLEGFCIKGKSSPSQYSFEGLTVAAGVTGRRYWRTGCDDWVIDKTCDSEAVQDSWWDYFFTGPMTMQKPVPFGDPARDGRSRFGTRASTVFVVGTLFDRRDFNHRLMTQWRKEGRPVHRVDVYTDRSHQEVIWPEQRDFAWVAKMKGSMGERNFNLRCRNIVSSSDEVCFTDADVAGALRYEWNFGDAPPGAELWLGFDPASGKRGKYSKYPAYALLGFVGERIHVVKWGRWAVPMPRQVGLLIENAQLYQCPVAVEDTSQQVAYKHWINQQASSVRVICHSTTQTTKRDWRQGVESLIPFFESGLITIHAGNATPEEVNSLRKELLDYPQGSTTDIVMAIWIAKYQQFLQAQRRQGGYASEAPSWVSRRMGSTVLDLRALRQGQLVTTTGGRSGYCPHCERQSCICPSGTTIRSAS